MYHWQDTAIAVSVFAFNIALLPSVIKKQKPNLATSLLTAIFLLPQLAAFYSLSLWYSFAMAAINAALWATLAAQRYYQTAKK